MRRKLLRPEAAPQKVDSLRRGLDILRLFRKGEFVLRSSEISSQLSLPLPTLQGLLDTLVNQGFLRYLKDADAYEPGSVCIDVGQAVRSSMSVLQVAQPFLQALAIRYDMTVTLAAREQLHMLRLVHCTGESAATFGVGVGELLPIASTAMGRAYIWALPSKEQAELMDQLRRQGGEGTAFAIPGIYGAFKELEERGYCFTITALVKNACAVAVPLVLEERAPVLSIGAMVSGLKHSEMLLREKVGPELLNVVEQIRAVQAKSRV